MSDIENKLLIESNELGLEDFDLDLLGLDESSDTTENKESSLIPPITPLDIIECEIELNGKKYKYHIFIKNKEFLTEYGFMVKDNKNTLGYIYPTLENVYNARLMGDINTNGNFKLLKTNNFADDLEPYVSNDKEYLIYRNYFKIYTLMRGVHIDGI